MSLEFASHARARARLHEFNIAKNMKAAQRERVNRGETMRRTARTKTWAVLTLALLLGLNATAQARKWPVQAAATAAAATVLAKDKQGQDIVAYFSAPNDEQDADAMAQPAAGGFYRVLLGKDAKGCFRIQDHYQGSGKRQGLSTTCNAADLTRWELRKAEGKLTMYRPNGQVRAESVFKNGRPHGVDRYYDDQGQVRISIVWQHGEMHGPFKLRDLSGQSHIEGVARNGDITRIKAAVNGQALSREAALALLDVAHGSWMSDMYR